MEIGEVIRKYRKARDMTQGEMASRLGVTAPAVNKWESGSSMPDITMLAPIARLLEISLDTLLSFHTELSDTEIHNLVQDLGNRLKSEDYHEVFQWMKKKLEQYPNCEELQWQMAVIFDAKRITEKIPGAERYDDYIRNCLERLLESRDEVMRTRAADWLFAACLRVEEYEKAEEYLTYFSDQNPEKKRKRADLFRAAHQLEEAYKAYEELLYSSYMQSNILLHSIYLTACLEDNSEKAHYIVKKNQELAHVFEMGEYQEASQGLELAVRDKDREAVMEIVEQMLANTGGICDFIHSSLYEHLEFKQISNEFKKELEEKLLDCFMDEETFDFMTGEPRWQELMSRYRERSQS